MIFFLSSAYILKITFIKYSDSQTAWIQIRPDNLAGLMWGPNCLQRLSADENIHHLQTNTVLPAKSDSVVMVCLQSYQGLIIDKSLVY